MKSSLKLREILDIPHVLVDERSESGEPIFRKCNSRIFQKFADTLRHAVTAVLYVRRESAAHYDVCFCLFAREYVTNSHLRRSFPPGCRAAAECTHSQQHNDVGCVIAWTLIVSDYPARN